MMTTESFFDLTSLILSKKEVLWIGSEKETPPPNLNPVLSKIKFVTYADAHKFLSKFEYQVVVLSLRADIASIKDDLIEKIAHLKLCEKILVGRGEPQMKISNRFIEAINAVSYSKILFLPTDETLLNTAILAALESYRKRTAENAERLNFNQQNNDLEDETTDLGEALKDHADHYTRSKLDIEKKISRMRALVRFVKCLTEVVSVEDLMRQLKEDFKLFHRVKEPILAFANSQNQLQLMFHQGSQILEKVIPGAWPQQIRIRLNDVKDSQFLANIFGRPFGKLLTLPLNLKRKSKREKLKVSAVLFFEHSLNAEEMKEYLNFIEERIHPISITLDRILLEHDLTEAAFLWERTFDGLQDPVVIFDSQSQIIRANKSFSVNLSSASPVAIQSHSLRHDEKFYQMHSYPISFGGEMGATHIINHYVDVTFAHSLQKQMIQNEKMAALGHLAGHIAHELNNPLTGVRSLAQILLSQSKTGTTIYSDIFEVEKAAERCQVIIKNLQEFSSGSFESQKSAVSINEIVHKTLPLLKTLISRYTVDIQLTDEESHVWVEPHLMQQVVFNIINNASQAMGETGQIKISTQRLPGTPVYVTLCIKDSGGGIAPEIQSQIFDFFFTTKSQGQGTGLGLSISKNIIDRFNGRIEVKSKTGEGSEFIIYLPVVPVES